jgi:hypothetical protein
MRPRVVYIVGDGRSGSTLLDRILGQIDGWFSCGELWYLWHNELCGCGARVNDCVFWRPVLAAVLDGNDGTRQADVLRLQREELGTSPIKLAAIARDRDRGRSAGSPAREYADLLTRLYREIVSESGARLVVDSSKLATRAYILAMLADVDLHVVHLVRDPRALAYAWGKKTVKYEGEAGTTYFSQLGPARSSVNWLRRHAVVELALRRRLGLRYLRLRYEDFARRPEAAVRSICALAGETDAKSPFLDEASVLLGPDHTVAGNPTRFMTGAISIREDEAWKVGLSRRSRVLATAIAAPLMHRYGYRL